MSDRHPDWPDGGDELLAAEYALGALDAAERKTAIRRIAQDAGFARLVAAWEQRLAPMAEAIAEAVPRADTWAAIERRIGPPLPRPARAASWWDNVSLWRWLTFGAGALAAAGLTLFLLSSTPQLAGEPMIATIAGESGAPIFVAMIDESGMLSVMPMAQADDPAHAHELWIIGKGENPISLGLVPTEGLRRMKMPPAHMERAHNGAMLAVSLEQPGGSTTGKPTTVLGAGPIQRL